MALAVQLMVIFLLVSSVLIFYRKERRSRSHDWGLRRGGEASPQAPHAYNDARLDPAHDEREEEDDVPGGDAQIVELGQVAKLPDNVGGHAAEMVKQSVVLEEVANYTFP